MSLNYLKLEKRFEEIGNLENILNILHWDMACNIKPNSQESRSKEIVSLSKILRQFLICDETKTIIALAQKEEQSLDAWQKANLQKIILKIQNEEIISEELHQNLILSTTKAEMIWRTARMNNDYELFKPYFQKVLYYQKELAQIKSQKFGLSLYDAWIDQFDHGNTTLNIKKTFNVLKEKLPLLIQQILKRQESKYKNNCVTHIPLDIPKQKELNYKMMSLFGFDFQQGRLDESTHPFCGGTPYDIRLTTRYNKNNFFSSFFGTMHELGHALYEQNLPFKYKNQPVGKALNFQFHESQSLLIEKQVAKSKAFCIFLSNYCKKELHLHDACFDDDNLYFQANKVKQDFIRVDADEVTYPLHIILRFEIEELLINDKLSLDDLPHLWNQKMQTYLGITPSNFAEGCLQDIHWASGSFGYFPSYLNGMIISAMVMKKYNSLYPHSPKDFSKGNFQNLNQYLNQNLRSFGSFYKSSELLFKATGETEINPYIFIEYLEKKYLS